jgi:hypothetical protein
MHSFATWFARRLRTRLVIMCVAEAAVLQPIWPVALHLAGDHHLLMCHTSRSGCVALL